MIESAFSDLYEKHKNGYQWKNTESMKKQFICHVYKVFFKFEWNIEPWRVKVGILCND